MLFTSVIIVLREILEAALLIATLLAATRFIYVGHHWLYISISSGIAGALLFAWQLRWISSLFDGLGYEISNAFLQTLIYIVILVLIALLLKSYLRTSRNKKPLLFFMGFALSLSIIREGSEIIIYFSGFLHAEAMLSSGIIGSIIGAGVGFSLGALFYFLLSAFHQSISLKIALALLVLVGAGMCSQATLLLMQADILPSQYPLWDTSNWIPEPSLFGQLLYALIGYEATPSPLHVGIYATSALISLMVVVICHHVYSRSTTTN